MILQLLLGDYVVLWRTYVIYGRPRWLRILIVILAVFLTSETFTLAAAMPINSKHTSIAAYGTLIGIRGQVLARLINIVPNLFAISLISYKAWCVPLSPSITWHY